jgi:hypothetical protein
MGNEFGFHDMQMRHNHVVKNATVFHVDGTSMSEVLGHGDVDKKDLQIMADSGRTFFVFVEMGERAGDNGWRDFIHANAFWKDGQRPFTSKDFAEFRSFARVVVENGEWEMNADFRRRFV